MQWLYIGWGESEAGTYAIDTESGTTDDKSTAVTGVCRICCVWSFESDADGAEVGKVKVGRAEIAMAALPLEIPVEGTPITGIIRNRFIIAGPYVSQALRRLVQFLVFPSLDLSLFAIRAMRKLG